MSKIFVTSDTHFHHANILKFNPSTRQHASIEAMNEFLIRDWNSKVTPQDRVIHLGDIGFASAEKMLPILRRLNGNITLVEGNHDNKLLNDPAIRKCFASIHTRYVFNHDGVKVVCDHFPLEQWDQCHRGAVHLHGHCHGNLKNSFPQRRIDVGVDAFCAGSAVASLEDVMRSALSQPIISHH